MIRSLALLGALLPTISAPIPAQDKGTVTRMIVPWPANGDTDNVFRALAPF